MTKKVMTAKEFNTQDKYAVYLDSMHTALLLLVGLFEHAGSHTADKLLDILDFRFPSNQPSAEAWVNEQLRPFIKDGLVTRNKKGQYNLSVAGRSYIRSCHGVYWLAA